MTTYIIFINQNLVHNEYFVVVFVNIYLCELNLFIYVNQIRYIWSAYFCRQYFLYFADWLESPFRPRESNVALYASEDLKIHTMADINPFNSLFEFNPDHALHNKEWQTAFVLDNKLREHFEQSETYPSPDMFLPNGIFSKMHIPNYIHVQV